MSDGGSLIPNSINQEIFETMRATINELPPTPKMVSQRKKGNNDNHENDDNNNNNKDDDDDQKMATAIKKDNTHSILDCTTTSTTEMSNDKGGPTPTIRYPATQTLSKLPSFKQTAVLLRKYPSLSRVRQLSSCRIELDDNDDETQHVGNHQGSLITPKMMETMTVSEAQSNVASSFASADDNNDDHDDNDNEAWTELEIEVLPGEFKRLRSSRDTEMALANGTCLEVACIFCTTRLACTDDDCEGVLCPTCLSVSPLEGLAPSSSTSTTPSTTTAQGMIGFGIPLEEIE